MIDHDFQARIFCRDLVDDIQFARHQQRHRQALFFSGRPHPLHGAVGEPGVFAFAQERKTQADHAGLFAPFLNACRAGRILRIKITEHAKALGMGGSGLHRDFIGLRVPAWRTQHHRIDTALFHFIEQIVLGVLRNLAVNDHRGAALPDMNLRINNQHVFSNQIMTSNRQAPGLAGSGNSIVPTMKQQRVALGVMITLDFADQD